MIKDLLLKYKWQLSTTILGLAVVTQIFHPREITVEKEVIRTVEVIKEVEKKTKETSVKDRDKKTTVTKPDGTVVVVEEKTKEKSKSSEVESKKEGRNETVAEQTKESSVPALSSFRVGYAHPISNTFHFSDQSFTLGVRIFSSPAFLDLHSQPFKSEYLIGVSFEF